MTDAERDALARALADLAAAAGSAVLSIGFEAAHRRIKADASLVTDADEAAEAVVLDGLARILPGVPIIAEEEVAAGRIPTLRGAFFLVDALDGTREFAAGRNEYTVNIAFVEDGLPVAGAVHQPPTATTWWGGAVAWRRQWGTSDAEIETRPYPHHGLTAIVSRSNDTPETQGFLAHLPVVERVPSGSSLKFCRVAEGAADVYARAAPIMEWDTAAGEAVLSAAGGVTRGLDGGLFLYGGVERAFARAPFAAWGRIALKAR